MTFLCTLFVPPLYFLTRKKWGGLVLNSILIAPVCVCALLAGCTMPQHSSRAPQTKTCSYTLPVLTPVESNKQDQEKEGIRVSVAPYAYIGKKTTRRQINRVPTLLVVNHEYPADLTEIPRIEVSPKELRFKVKIHNRLERVMRLAGTVVSFQMAGKTVAVNKAGYEDFLNGIILPRQEAEYEIVGPDLTTLPENATIAFLLYDMVTETDAAGNPTKRSNFEFFYTLAKENKTESVPIVTRRVYVDERGQVIR